MQVHSIPCTGKHSRAANGPFYERFRFSMKENCLRKITIALLIHEVFWYQSFAQSQKGSLMKFLGTVWQKNIDILLWYPPMVYEAFTPDRQQLRLWIVPSLFWLPSVTFPKREQSLQCGSFYLFSDLEQVTQISCCRPNSLLYNTYIRCHWKRVAQQRTLQILLKLVLRFLKLW